VALAGPLQFDRLGSHPGQLELYSLRMWTTRMPERKFRNPAEPSPPPVKEPIDPPENPDMPIREPDPEDPNEI
jgi:hypothetical protein